MTFYNALITLTFRRSLDIDEISFIKEGVNCDGVARLMLAFKTLELGQVALGSYSGFCKVTGHRLGRVLLLFLLEAELKSIIAVGSRCLDLSNYAGTYLDNSARHVFAVGTENGCHSDFLS